MTVQMSNFSTTKPTCTDLGANPGPRSD